jgi:hypothetical protein
LRVAKNDHPLVLSVATLIGIEMIDGGDTAAMRFRGADGEEVGMLIPRKTASLILAELSDALAQPHRRDRREG